MSEKSPEAFRTISEVADDLDLPQHVLRFWETRFSQIKPLKRGGGRRYYRPEDVNLLRGIRHLLYGEGYTIKGVQRILKEQGVRYVMGVWSDAPGDDRPDEGRPAAAESRTPASRESGHDLDPPDVDQPDFEQADFEQADFEQNDDFSEADEAPVHHQRPAEGRRPGDAALDVRAAPEQAASRPAPDATPAAHVEAPQVRPEPPVAPLAARAMSGPRPGAATASPPRLDPEAVRQLKAALYELMECKRLLDDVRRTG